MKLFFSIFTLLFFTTTLFAQTKFEDMKKQYDTYRKEEKQDSALAVAKRINKWAFEIEKDTSLHYAVSFRSIGNSFYSQKLNDSAIFYYNRSLTQLELQKRNDHLDYAKCITNLGKLYVNEKDYSSAELYYKQASEITRKILGEQHPEYAYSLNSLASLYEAIYNYKSAELYYKQALEIIKKVLGEQHPNYTACLFNLGRLYKDIGDYKSAKSYYNLALLIRKKVLGEHHPDYASCLNNVAASYKDMDNYKLAEIYYKQALEIRREVLGNQHIDYASSLINLGALYNDMDNYKSAELCYKEALDIIKKVLGMQHPYYLSLLNNLGVIYYNMGNYMSAELYYKQALNIRKEVFGDQDPDYTSFLNNLGVLYSDIGDYKSAESYYMQALEIRKKILGEQNPDYAASLNNLGVLYSNIGDYKSAESYYKHALVIKKRVLGDQNTDYASSLNNLGVLYSDIGDYKLAESYYMQALEIRKKISGEQDPDYAASLNNLGVLYSYIGDYKSSEIYYKKVLKIRREVFGEQHFDFYSCLYNIAVLYSKTNRINEATFLYNKVFNVLNNNISTNFQWLNDNEKELFWNKNQLFYNAIDNFVSTNFIKFPALSELCYNSNIITKGKLLEAKLTKDNAIANSNSEVESLYNQLAVIRKKMAKIEDSDSAIQYKKLDAEANDLDAKLSRLWSDYAQQKKNLSITWNQVQENLSSDEAAIEFVRYKAEKDSLYHYNALIIRKTDVNPILVKLCTENQLKEINSKEGFSSYYPLVWAPLEAYLKNIKTIYYSPIGLLNTIPFSALYPKKGEGEVVTFDKKTQQMVTTIEPDADFLMNRYTLHQLTSTRYLAMGLKDKALDKVESSINLVGGVNYDYLPGDKIEINKGTEYASRGANSINPLKYLEGTKTEVETINKTLKLNGWETSLLEHNDTTEENIEKLENQNAKGVLHIATHGFAFEDARGTSATIDHASIKYNLSYNPDPMKRCGLIFAGGNWAWIGSDELTKRNPDAEDGILTAAQVALLNLKKTKLVVLSACETGLGKIVEGNEGVFGLKRAFKLAGVEQIIVSLWEVADKETMELMTLFYEDLAITRIAIISFEKAQKTMKDNYPTRPDLWAGFVLVR